MYIPRSFSRYEKHIIPIMKILEKALTLINVIVFCSHMAFFLLAASGVVYKTEDISQLYLCYLVVLVIAAVELLLTLIQRLLMKMVDIRSLEAILSQRKALMRFLVYGFLEGVACTIMAIAFSFFHRHWLGEDFPGGFWGKYVSSMYVFIIVLSIAAKTAHLKLWKAIME